MTATSNNSAVGSTAIYSMPTYTSGYHPVFPRYVDAAQSTIGSTGWHLSMTAGVSAQITPLGFAGNVPSSKIPHSLQSTALTGVGSNLSSA